MPDIETKYKGYSLINKESTDLDIVDLHARANEIVIADVPNPLGYEVDGIDPGRTVSVRYRITDGSEESPGPFDGKFIATVNDGFPKHILVSPGNVKLRKG